MSARPTEQATRVLLVRHGESTWNAERIWQGQADPPLSTLGEQQAADAAQHVEGVDAIWSSDLVRARRTAEILAQRRGLLVVVDARLRERDAGEWEGLTRTQIEGRYPGYLGSGRRPPGYEGDASLATRAIAAIDAIGAAHRGRSVLVVTHGGVVRTLERHLGAADDGLLPNLGGRSFVWAGDGWSLGDRVLLLEAAEVTRPEQI
jgi:broad specificity phosphatase PhoE